MVTASISRFKTQFVGRVQIGKKTTFVVPDNPKIYTDFYIKGELLKQLTSHFSSSLLPKNLRTKNKQNFSENELIEYKKKLQTKYISYSDNWQFDKLYNIMEKEGFLFVK